MGDRTHGVDNIGRVGATAACFVGREREIAILGAALDDACGGRGRLVMLAGEPGIGKTSLARELERLARQRGAQVLWGRCWEGGGAPAFWPWVQVIRAHAAACRVDSPTSMLGADVADLCILVPELRAQLPKLPVPEGLDAGSARFRLFDSVTRFLCHASRQQPLLIVLDDVQRADEASLRLLQFLAGELAGAQLLVLATYRDTELRRSPALSQMLGELAATSDPIHLAAMSEREVARLIENTAGRIPSRSVVEAVYERTEGNPLFVTELARLAALEGWSESKESEWLRKIPIAVREAIRLRLGWLSEPCQRVLEVAAVIGRDFDLDILNAVGRARFTARSLSDLAAPSDQPCPEPRRRGERVIGEMPTAGPPTTGPAGLLDEAMAAGFVGRIPNTISGYRFAHVLTRDTLYEELGSSQRAALHRRIGEAIEVLYRGFPDPYLPALAYHFYAAIPGGMAPKAHEYAVRVAQQSAAVAAYEDAVEHYEQALQALDHCPPEAAPGAGRRSIDSARGSAHAEALEACGGAAAGVTDELVRRRCDLLVALGEAQYNAGRRGASRTTLLQAAALARRLAAPEPLARAALALIGPGEWTADLDMDAVELLSAALSALGSADSPLRAQVLSRLAGALYASADRERRIALSREAVAIAERLGEPNALALVLGNAHFALLGPDNVEERLVIATRIVDLAEAAGSTARAMSGHYWRLLDLLQLGDIAAADIALHHYTRYAAELRQPFDVWRASSAGAMRALLAGRFDEGERLAFEAFQAGQRSNSPNLMLTFASQLYTLRREQGRLDELEAEVKQFVEQFATVPATRGALALLYSELGREAEARAEFEKLAAQRFADVPRDVSWLNALDMAAQVCAFLGDRERAGILYDLLLPHAQQIVVVSYADACHGAVARSLGLLAETLGRWDDAAAHYASAIALNTQLGAPHFAARTQHAYAEMLFARERGRPARSTEDRDKAVSLLAGAIATYEQLGMSRYLQQAVLLREKIAQQSPGSKDPQPEPSVFRRDGQRWRVAWRGRVFSVRHTKGVAVIAHLMQHPRRRFHVTELAAVAENRAMPAGSRAQLQAPENAQDVERVRKRISALLRTAYRSVAAHDPDLRRYLANAIRPWGKALSYEPEADRNG